MEGNNRIPLLVCGLQDISMASTFLRNPYLVNDTIPGEASVVDDDVNLAIAKFCRLLHQLLDVCVVQHITRDMSCRPTFCIDLLCYSLCLGWQCELV